MTTERTIVFKRRVKDGTIEIIKQTIFKNLQIVFQNIQLFLYTYKLL